jgi:hypothetical protein
VLADNNDLDVKGFSKQSVLPFTPKDLSTNPKEGLLLSLKRKAASEIGKSSRTFSKRTN